MRTVNLKWAEGKEFYLFDKCPKCKGKLKIRLSLKETSPNFLQRIVDWIYSNYEYEECDRCDGTGKDYCWSSTAKMWYEFEDGSPATKWDWEAYQHSFWAEMDRKCAKYAAEEEAKKKAKERAEKVSIIRDGIKEAFKDMGAEEKKALIEELQGA